MRVYHARAHTHTSARAHARARAHTHTTRRSHPSRTHQYMYHMWLNQWQTHQFNLDFETFDGKTEIVIVTDFSAVYEVR